MAHCTLKMGALTTLALAACQAREIRVVDCTENGDCAGGGICSDGTCRSQEPDASIDSQEAGAPIDDADRINYAFDGSTQGWLFNDWDDPFNIHVHVPKGGVPPTLEFSETEGDPAPGALVVNMPFTEPDQSLDVTVRTGPIDLSRQRLRARVKLLSGSSAYLQLYANSAPTYVFHGALYGQSSFAAGRWVLLELNPLTALSVAFRPAEIVQIGIVFVSVDPSAGPVRMAIDSVQSVDAVIPPPGGAERVNYTFEGGIQGWVVGDDPGSLSAQPNEDGASATIEARTEEGDPNSGMLVVSARFTAPGQRVVATVYPSRGDLFGRRLRARVRRAAGSMAYVRLGARSGQQFVETSIQYLGNVFPLGEWVTLELELDAVTTPGFDPSVVGQIDVSFESVVASDDPVVMEIDSVTDG